MPADAVLHDAERLQDRATQARAISQKRNDEDTKLLLMALAENFERLAVLATEEGHTELTATASPSLV